MCSRKHALVTGAESGIGQATARELVKQGYHVFAGQHRGGSADPGTNPTTLPLDITKADNIAAARTLIDEHGCGLDALINVAGIGVSAPLELLAIDQLRLSLEVNTVGQVAVTQALLPAIRQNKGRIVFIGSVGDRTTVPFAGALTSSKWAVAALAFTFRQELSPWGIDVVLIEPASIHTPAVEGMAAAVQETLRSWSPTERELYGAAFQETMAAFLAGEKEGSMPSVVAEKIAHALTVSHPHARYLVGKDSHVLAAIARLPQALQDKVKREKFGLPAAGSQEGGQV